MNSFTETLRELAGAFPATATSAEAVVELDSRVQRLTLEPFFEPVSITLVSKGNKREILDGERQLLDLGFAELTSWTRHIAYGTRCRMRALEGSVVGHLSRGEALPAMILLRSHVEAAAVAAHCLAELGAAARQDNLQALGQLVAATLFGTALKKHRGNTSVADLLNFFEGDCIRICAAINSLDRFYYQEHADGKLAVAYSLLCEFAHPNHRGVMDFMVATEQATGWEVKYQLTETPKPDLVAGAIDTLLVSMRAGYSAGELLRCWHFSEQASQLVYRRPSPDQRKAIWEDLLQRPAGAA